MSEQKLHSILIVWLPTLAIMALIASSLILFSIGSDYKILFNSPQAAQIEDLEVNCINNAQKLSLITEKKGALLRLLTDGQSQSPMQSFSDMSTALLMCDGYVLDYFCAGTGCSTDGKIIADLKKIEK